MSMRPALFVIAGLFCAFALWVSPERLSSLGIMDRSLASENGLTRETALLEIFLARYAAFAIAALCALLALFWPRLQKTRGYKTLMSRNLRYPDRYEDALGRLWDPALRVILMLLVASFIYLALAETLFSRATLVMINREDGMIEYTSALLLILAAGYAGYTGLFAATRPASRGFHLFLALLFFAMCGEEISWGQRIFGFETPESLSGLNVQNEVNLHNMFGYLFDHLFILCFFLWGCIIPLLYHMSRTSRQVMRWAGLPIPSIGLAIGMLLITLYQDQIILAVFDPVPRLRIPEMREFFSAAAFLALMRQSYTGLVARSGAKSLAKI